MTTTYKRGTKATAAVWGIGTGVLMQIGIGYIGEKLLMKPKTIPGLTVAVGAYVLMTYAGAYASVGTGCIVWNAVMEAGKVEEETDDVDEDTSE